MLGNLSKDRRQLWRPPDAKNQGEHQIFMSIQIELSPVLSRDDGKSCQGQLSILAHHP